MEYSSSRVACSFGCDIFSSLRDVSAESLTPLVEPDSSQYVYIAPEAFKVASAKFKDEIEFPA